ncbi:hypothetical protein RIF29_18682 [Crotalaria pallida]|uniref:Uncharacterized protein n=1 Tax=Crotalaria pallida TaxID=3830 RepID=A0AAN9F6D4_CROPI
MSLSSCLSSHSDQPLLPLPLSAALRHLPRPFVIPRPSPSAFTLRPLFLIRLPTPPSPSAPLSPSSQILPPPPSLPNQRTNYSLLQSTRKRTLTPKIKVNRGVSLEHLYPLAYITKHQLSLYHLVCGAFDGASMNPAVSFGPALESWTWTHHWVYWLDRFIGSAAAAILYDNIFIGDDAHHHQPLSNTDF